MEPRFFRTPAQLRAWYEKRHATAKELVVGFRRKDSGLASVTYQEALDEALCFGWIDGIRRSRDATSYTIRFTPRAAKSVWSRVNIANARRLAKEGRMRPAGRKAFDARGHPKARPGTRTRRRRHPWWPPSSVRCGTTGRHGSTGRRGRRRTGGASRGGR